MMHNANKYIIENSSKKNILLTSSKVTLGLFLASGASQRKDA